MSSQTLLPRRLCLLMLLSTVFCTLLFTAPAVCAEAPPALKAAPPAAALASPLDRLIFTLGVILALSQAIGGFIILLEQTVIKWLSLLKSTAAARAEEPELPMWVYRPWALVVMVAVALYTRLDAEATFNSGALTRVDVGLWPLNVPFGVILTAFFICMGSSLLKQLLDLLNALKDLKVHDAHLARERRRAVSTHDA